MEFFHAEMKAWFFFSARQLNYITPLRTSLPPATPTPPSRERERERELKLIIIATKHQSIEPSTRQVTTMQLVFFPRAFYGTVFAYPQISAVCQLREGFIQ